MKINLLLLSMLLANIAMAQYAPAGDKIKTKWADQVSPENALPEYPRPMMVRSEWQNLNGLWQYAITPKVEMAPERYTGDLLLHARQRRLDAERHKDVASVFFGSLLPFRRDGVLPQAVEVFPFGAHHHWARILRQGIFRRHLGSPFRLDFVANRSILSHGDVC